MNRPAYILAISLLLATPVAAACPPQGPGNLPQSIKDNGDRIVCLQRELGEDANRRQLEMELRALETRLQQIELQQRLNAIKVPVLPPVPVALPPQPPML